MRINLASGTVTVKFSEVIIMSDVTLSDCLLVSGSGVQHVLSNSQVTSSDGNYVVFQLSATMLNTISTTSDLCSSATDCSLSLGVNAVKNKEGNGNAAILVSFSAWSDTLITGSFTCGDDGDGVLRRLVSAESGDHMCTTEATVYTLLHEMMAGMCAVLRHMWGSMAPFSHPFVWPGVCRGNPGDMSGFSVFMGSHQFFSATLFCMSHL